MADSRAPRPSTDQETAPLLRDPEAEEGGSDDLHPSLSERLSTIAQEPLTPLSKILLVVALILLLLSSIFIGLFAGTQHKLDLEKKRNKDGEEPVTTTTTLTVTATSTSTSVSTSTVALPAPTHTPPEIPPSESVCITADCIVLSASILSSLDVSQDPCENFYEYANGGWLSSHPLPAAKGSLGQFEQLSIQNEQIIQKILESNSTSTTASYDAQILRKLRNLYSSCMDENRLDDIGMAPLLDFVSTVRGLFRGETTVLEHDDDNEEDEGDKKTNNLTAALAFLHSRGIDALFSFYVEGDVGADPNYMALWFNQPDLGLPAKEYYQDKSILKVYRDVIERLILAVSDDEDLKPRMIVSEKPAPLTVNQDSANVWPPWPWPPWGDTPDDDGGDDDKGPVNRTKRAHKLAKQVIKFESLLANASLDLDVLQQDPVGTYNPTPISNLTATLYQIQFPDYFSTFTPRSFPTQALITYPPYPVSLSEILNHTSPDVIETYLVVRAALSLSPHLGMGTEAWQAQRTLEETLTGIKKGVVGDRAEYCVGKVENSLGFAAGRYFVNETFGGDSREKSLKVITDIVESFKASLSDIKWMDKQSADAAAAKADAIRVKVGYPTSPNTEDARSIANYYTLVKIRDDKFFENMLSAATSDQYKMWAQLGKQRDVNSWEMYPSEVNAYFNPPANEIVFPAGILRPPFFSHDWPSYLSYGSFGWVAAHELTHAFDSAGRRYNQDGKLEEWWTNSTSEGYDVIQDCIVKQYSSYSIDDGKGGKIYVNGKLTSGENIGDTGLIQAYRAWKAQYNTSAAAGNEYLLPGLNYTREQLFFLSSARIWARSMKPAAAVQRILTDPHSPSEYRVDGTMYNIPEFSKAFNCSAKAKLNPPPEKQCIFW